MQANRRLSCEVVGRINYSKITPTPLPYFAEVKQGGMYIKFRYHCLSSAKMSQSAK